MAPRTPLLPALAALLALLVAALVVPVVGTAAAAGLATTRVQGWSTETVAVPRGQTWRATVRVRTGARHVARRALLQFRPAGGRWSTVHARRTTSAGRVTLALTVQRSGDVRVRVPATSRARAAATSPRPVRVAIAAARADRFESAVLRLVGDLRAHGTTCGGRRVAPQPGLARQSRLDHAAGEYAARMADEGFFDHYDPARRDAGDRADAVGYEWQRIGENLAAGQDTPAEVVEAWHQSRDHCLNMLGDYDHVGVGYAERAGSPYGTYWVLLLGVPRE